MANKSDLEMEMRIRQNIAADKKQKEIILRLEIVEYTILVLQMLFLGIGLGGIIFSKGIAFIPILSILFGAVLYIIWIVFPTIEDVRAVIIK